MEALTERLERAVTRLEQLTASRRLSGGNCVNGIDGVAAGCVEAFDVLLKGPLTDYMNISRTIGSDVEQHAEMVKDALQTQRTFLKMASEHREPAQTDLQDLLKPISDHIQEIQSFRERNRGSRLFNHLSAVSESIPALGWVAVKQKPGPYVKEMNDAATFYTNRVLKDYKETDRRHVDWVRSYLSIWIEMQAFIKHHHATGLLWSQRGPLAPVSLFEAPVPPCPPPPPPPPPATPSEDHQAPGSALHSALFAQLNRGLDITKGLKHVSDDQKIHKDPHPRSHEAPSGNAGPKKASPQGVPQKKPPLLELEGKKWRVENFQREHDLTIQETELRQVVYVFACNDVTLHVKGKLNSIIVDNCTKLGLVFDDVVGIVEVINSKAVQLQVLGSVPTISINKTDGCQLYLSPQSLGCHVVSAKSSEMNVLVPQGDDDYKELPLPEQFKTVWDGSKLVTEPSETAA
ncbi:adenylyl cyclase-associated protein 2 [Syngnathoides biaculeatus]|uniref:adenylyl cyclase-associated protein 2 n=1 Tax=Syngnathoides biaculeatus TaxID=300417 RepID=UPI002ADE1FC9|nr:adenylyl cyclase-associated protein 2 [Syngnathoides biaculeatus]XP_061677083.1 adenylyl cyclase-associated protein 2 [Syngnathoides biaculeatus]XP_061677093.1 adenylyl cyclase-associated protein 2 [Syngnathoides biaculeatus]XP_061677101.1 adenylyl cyclase-associated protein 2 [Syngnathoides biaculeatus]